MIGLTSQMKRRIEERRSANALRSLSLSFGPVDLFSNDYLGVARRHLTDPISSLAPRQRNGSTGSRLLSGESEVFQITERELAERCGAESALLFSSGYSANLGLLSCVPSRHDTVLYDELVHASIRDGIRLGHARSYSFRHNDCDDLMKKISRARGELFIAVESVYSMDGDITPLRDLVNIARATGARLIVDEAHSTGIFGEKGEGLCASLGITKDLFAVVHTFGKAVGSHGAAVLCSSELREYLINFSRPFIYTTAPAPHSVACLHRSLRYIASATEERARLFSLIEHFNAILNQYGSHYPKAESAIYALINPGNDVARGTAAHAQELGYEVRAILSPTVPKGKERIRICLHSYNTEEEIEGVLGILLSNQGR